MPEQPAELRRINWSSSFAFTQLFRTFKMAIHPGKLGLALAGLLLFGLWGYLLDTIWLDRHQPVAAEVDAFWQTPDVDRWRADVIENQAEIVRTAYREAGQRIPDPIAKELADDPRAGVESALTNLRELGYAELRATTQPAEQAESASRFTAAYRTAELVRPRGVFASLLDFETSAIRQFIDGAATLNFTGGLREVAAARHGQGFAADLPQSVRERLPGTHVVHVDELNIGALPALILMVRGIQWLVMEHPWFALLLFLGKLGILAFFGGAICRLAAMNFARDERIPLRSALAFARRKYIALVTAPLLPIGLILALGVPLFLGGVLGSIPYIGGLLAGLGMILALLAGFVMALVLIGLLAGGNLMWPTIAVEDSDSFDAMSRSYSYVFSRPWLTALYALIAAVYGAICYLFLRFLVWLLMRLTRFFVGAGMAWTARPETGDPGATRMDVLWPMPTFDSLLNMRAPFGAAYWDDTVGYWLILLWNGLLALLLCSFLVTFFLSAVTIIYFLLRREVDATDLDDVNSVEGEDEDIVHGTTAPSPATGSPEASPPAAESGPPPARA